MDREGKRGRARGRGEESTCVEEREGGTGLQKGEEECGREGEATGSRLEPSFVSSPGRVGEMVGH